MEQLLKELHFKQMPGGEWELAFKNQILQSGKGLVCISKKAWSVYAIVTIVNWLGNKSFS